MQKFLDWWFYHKKQAIILGVIILGVISIGIIGYFNIHSIFNNDKNKEKKEIKLVNDEQINQQDIEEVPENTVSVDIKGAVNTPGVYNVKENSRVGDVLAIAGGSRDDADLSVINLSKKVYDEMVVIIYTKNEVKKFTEVKKEETTKQEKCVNNNENITNNACVCPSPTISNTIENTTKKISLNSASKEELTTLSGIGESKALLIIEYREKNGPFKSIEELKNISGIGDSLFEKIKENITL